MCSISLGLGRRPGLSPMGSRRKAPPARVAGVGTVPPHPLGLALCFKAHGFPSSKKALVLSRAVRGTGPSAHRDLTHNIQGGEMRSCPGGSDGKNLPARRATWVQSLGWEDPLEKKWQPTPVFLPGESHGQRSLAGYSLWGSRELDTTERLTLRILREHTRPPKSPASSPSLPSAWFKPSPPLL